MTWCVTGGKLIGNSIPSALAALKLITRSTESGDEQTVLP
jgi:hypothetical protein